MDILKNVLEEVKNGRDEFAPRDKTKQSIADFQIIAKALAFANEEKLLDKYLAHKNTETCDIYYDLILVPTGLNYHGELYLQKNDTPQSEHKNDILHIKPGIFGVSIDLKEVWRRYIGR